MTRPKIWGDNDTARIVGEARVRGLQMVDAPYLSASGPGFVANKQDQFAEVHLIGGGEDEVEFEGNIIFTPGVIYPGDPMTMNSFGPPFSDETGPINDPLGTEYTDAFAYTARPWWVDREPSWVARASNKRARLTRRQPRKYGGRNWISKNEKEVLSWAGPSSRAMDIRRFIHDTMSTAGALSTATVDIRTVSATELLDATLRNRVHHLFPDTVIYYRGAVLLDLLDVGLAWYTPVVYGGVSTTTATRGVVGAAFHTKDDGSRVLRFVTTNGYIEESTVWFYETAADGTGVPTLLHTYTIPIDHRAHSDWYFNASGTAALCTLDHEVSEPTAKVVQWTISGVSVAHEPSFSRTYDRTQLHSFTGDPPPPTALGQSTEATFTNTVTDVISDVLTGALIYADFSGDAMVLAELGPSSSDLNSTITRTQSCTLSSARSLTFPYPYYWSTQYEGDFTSTASSSGSETFADVKIGGKVVLKGGIQTYSTNSADDYVYGSGLSLLSRNGSSSFVSSLNLFDTAGYTVCHIDARFGVAAVFVPEDGRQTTRIRTASGTTLSTSQTTQVTHKFVSSGVWRKKTSVINQYSRLDETVGSDVPPYDIRDVSPDIIVSQITHPNNLSSVYPHSAVASSAVVAEAEQGLLGATINSSFLNSSGVTEELVGTVVVGTRPLISKARKLLLSENHTIDHISRI